MILVDSSVWIDYLRDKRTAQTAWLEANLQEQDFLIGDLILAEILQGRRAESDAETALSQFSMLRRVDIGGWDCAIAAAANYRKLRALGHTPRKTIDTLIATRCILDGLVLLHDDRDFEPFQRHLGLQTVQAQ